MPIELQFPVTRLSESDFHELDYQIMKIAFAVHNDLGRFHNEGIYQAEMSRRCEQAGIAAIQEFTIKLIHDGFEKPLFVDLLINQSTVYELKAKKQLVDANRIQTLNYLFGTETHHGKLVNFRPKSVESEFVSTLLDHEKRRTIKLSDNSWARGHAAEKLQHYVTGLLYDWGAFFDTDIYLEAVCHFLGGKEAVIHDTKICSGHALLGHQKLPHLTDTEAFIFSSANKNIPAYEEHLIRFLNHTSLEYLHWINFNRSEITFSSLSRKSFCP